MKKTPKETWESFNERRYCRMQCRTSFQTNYSKMCHICFSTFSKDTPHMSWKLFGERTFCSKVCARVGLSILNKKIGRVPPSAKGKTMTEKQKLAISKSNKTAYESPERRLAISKRSLGIPRYKMRGENNPFWRGGITEKNRAIRTSLEYKNWRRAVFKRDDWTCVLCLVSGGELNADHIKPFAFFPELRFTIDNGRTLCTPCHKQTDTFGSKAFNYKKTNKQHATNSN